MTHQPMATVLSGLALAMFCLMVPPTTQGQIFLFSFAGIGGAFSAYVSTRHSPIPNRLEKSVLLGGAVGLLGAVVCFGISALVISVSGNVHAVFNLHSTNLALIGATQLTVVSGLGGLLAGLLSKGRFLSRWKSRTPTLVKK